MDKALKEIKENELKIKELEEEREKNSIKKEEIKDKTLEDSINRLKNLIECAKIYKKSCDAKLEMLKANRGVFIFLVLSVIFAINLSFFVSMPIPRDMSVFYFVALSTTTLLGGSAAIATRISKTILNLRIESLDKDILERTSELKEKTALLNEIKKQVNELEEKDVELFLEVNKLEQRNDSLKNIRSEVIESFINNNPELHLLLDNEYNKNVDTKQKVKKK